MNICVLTVSLNTFSGSRAPIELTCALAHRGHQLTIIATQAGLDLKLLRRLHQKKITVIVINDHLLSGFWQLTTYFKNHHFDVISFHGTPLFFLAAKLTKLPIIRTYYGTQLDAVSDKWYLQKNLFITLGNWLGNTYVKTVEKLILTNSNKIVAISKYVRDEVNQFYQQSADMCYLGVANFFKPVKKNSKSKTITILSVSRLVPYKGFHWLIEIVKQLPPTLPLVHLMIVGQAAQPNYVAYLRRLANKKISIITSVSDEKLQEYYFQADIYATCDRFLFFGLPVLEAARVGLPAIALDRCAAHEVIKHTQTGFVAADMSTFEKYLMQLIKSKSLRQHMGSHAKVFAKQFTWEKTAKQYETILKKSVR